MKFTVEVQATNKTWFVAEGGESVSAERADEMVKELRSKGFNARARML